jgi:hypothetical protein
MSGTDIMVYHDDDDVQYYDVISDCTVGSLLKNTRWIYFILLQLLPVLMSIHVQITPAGPD